MPDKEIIFTFSYNTWALATTVEIIANTLVSGGDMTWIDWTGKFVKKHEYPVASKLHINQVRRGIRRSNLIEELNKLGANSTFRYQNTIGRVTNYEQEINKLAEEVAYLELISVKRESNPDKNLHKTTLKLYKDSFMKTYKEAKNLLKYKQPSKVFLYNGRFLQERAVWEACRNLNISVAFFEKFNPNWHDRYLIFKEQTHSPQYRSNLMNNFFLNSTDNENINDIGQKWFKDRTLGITQNFTDLQNQNLGLSHLKPFLVYFHSSEDELITSELISASWGDQISALKNLIEVMNNTKKYNLVIRLHPNLLQKSPREIHKWNNLVNKISNECYWVTVVASDSKISSYKLVEESIGVITVGSTIGVEAAFMNRKSILIGTAFHEFMGITINPKNKIELNEALNKNLTEKEKLFAKNNSLKYAIYQSIGGVRMAYVNPEGNINVTTYKFKNFEIKYSKVVLILISIFKYAKKNIVTRYLLFLPSPHYVFRNFTRK